MITDNFLESKQDFQRFLSEQGLSSEVLWIFREDLVCLPKRFLVKVPLPKNNETLAETFFNIGRERNFGICLHAFCLLNEKVCCYIQLPDDDLESQYSLMSNERVKFSVRTNLINARPVTNFFRWQFYRLVEKFSDTRYSVPENLPLRGLRFHSVTSALSYDASRS
jgi:hypothetical protein